MCASKREGLLSLPFCSVLFCSVLLFSSLLFSSLLFSSLLFSSLLFAAALTFQSSCAFHERKQQRTQSPSSFGRLLQDGSKTRYICTDYTEIESMKITRILLALIKKPGRSFKYNQGVNRSPTSSRRILSKNTFRVNYPPFLPPPKTFLVHLMQNK